MLKSYYKNNTQYYLSADVGKVYNVEKRLFSKHPSLNRTRIRVTDDDLNDIRGLQTKHRRSSNLFFLPAIQVDRIFGANKENESSTNEQNQPDLPLTPRFDGLQKYKLEDFKIEYIVGAGLFGQVFKAVHVPSKQTVAIKKMKKPADASEIEIQKKLTHKNLLGIIASFEDKVSIHLILPYCSENLFQLMRRKNELTERRVAKYTLQVCEGVSYMHSQGVMHRDIKPENILINAAGFLLVADFGCSTLKLKSNKRLGTPGYMAPEVWAERNYTKIVDSWSVGVLIYELLIKKLPYGEEEPEVTQNVVYAKSLSKEAVDLMKGLLQFQPAKRKTMAKVLNHQWFPLMQISEIQE